MASRYEAQRQPNMSSVYLFVLAFLLYQIFVDLKETNPAYPSGDVVGL